MSLTEDAESKVERRTGILRSLPRILAIGFFFGGTLAVSSGRLDWAAAWVFIGIGLSYYVVVMCMMKPDLVRERLDSLKHRDGRQRWDLVVSTAAFYVGPFLSMALAGCDARFGWSTFPVGLQVVGGMAMAAGLAFAAWAVHANRFFSALVRIQKDRGHRVVTDGPYRFVRHPGYVGFILYVAAIPVLLGSWWALAAGAFSVACVLLRTALEDRMLRKELDGYEEYASRVKYRLVPGVW